MTTDLRGRPAQTQPHDAWTGAHSWPRMALRAIALAVLAIPICWIAGAMIAFLFGLKFASDALPVPLGTGRLHIGWFLDVVVVLAGARMWEDWSVRNARKVKGGQTSHLAGVFLIFAAILFVFALGDSAITAWRAAR